LLAAPVETTASPGPRTPSSAASPADWPDVPGYDILEVLGSGGMGVVYRARQRALGRLVALKMVRGDACPDHEQLQRFKREAEAVARLQHPNIVQIHDVGEHNGRPYFSMELLEGGSLRSRRGSVTPRESAEVVEALARAIHEAHCRGIVHRDLKPGNVLLTADGTPRVTDFGLARDLASESLLTPSGAVLGTPAHMAPEQAEGKAKEAGPAADIYALGAILYELLTGQPPFKGPTTPDILVQVLTRDPVPPRKRKPGVSRDLETICLKCLEKTAERRYLTARDLAEDLRRFLDGRPIEARPAPAWERGVKYVRRRPVLALSVAVAFVACLGLGAWGWEKRRADEHKRRVAAREEERLRADAERKQVKIEYFANLIRRRGVPEGVGRLSEVEASRRHSSFRFSRQDGRVAKVEVVNGMGCPSPNERLATIIAEINPAQREELKECAYKFEYSEGGNIKTEIASNRNGKKV
jgi:serine/threonine-protein kinase